MRTSIPLALVASVVVASGCPSRSPAKSDDGEDDHHAPQDARDVGGQRADVGTGEALPAEVAEVEIDDANRFVQQDLERFMKAFPDVLREQDELRMASCIGDACLAYDASKSLGPFTGEGIRYLVPLWLRGCLTGSADACMQAGRTYQGSQYTDGPVHTGLSKDELQARFRLYIDRACRLDEHECEQWADFTLGDDAPTQDDVDRAIARLESGCADSEYGSCAALARHAPDYPAIGSEIEWWRKACEHHPRSPNRECSRYAALLLAGGNPADTKRAKEVLGEVCTPQSKPWSRGCEGDPELGEEVCDFIYADQHAEACLLLAERLDGTRALRLTAAMCVESLLPEGNALGREACEKADKLAKAQRKPKAYLAGLAKRVCAVDYMDCLEETFDIRACSEKQETCERQVGK